MGRSRSGGHVVLDARLERVVVATREMREDEDLEGGRGGSVSMSSLTLGWRWEGRGW